MLSLQRFIEKQHAL